ncbi:MAG: methylated-DNA--[protein]-cysteine S-methyltransferase [Actinomycetota bacterium]
MSDTAIRRALRGDARAIEAASRDAAERLAARLAGEAEVAYGYTDSPIGRLILAVTDHGLVRLQWIENDEDETLQELADKVSPRILLAPPRLDDVRRELDEYFAGDRTEFEVPLDMRMAKGFTRKVLEATSRIPFGSVSTYRDVAKRAGSPRGMRATGNALGWNRIPIVIPCHRVVRTGGGLGGYGGGLDRKRTLLAIEGVSFEDGE